MLILSLVKNVVSIGISRIIPHRFVQRFFGGYYSGVDGGIPRRNPIESFFYDLTSSSSTTNTEGSRILLVGEGDLGFSAFLSSLQNEDTTFEIVASTWDTQDQLFASFPKAKENVASILDANPNNKVLYEVDATKLSSTMLLEDRFDTIWWNFPHTPGKANIKRNRLLMVDFMNSAKPFLKSSSSSSIKIALCGNQSGCTPATADTILWNASWKLIDAAAESGFLLTEIEKFDRVLEHEDMKRYYEPVGWRGNLGKFSAYRGDNANVFTMKDPLNNIESDIMAVKAVQAPLYSHELHLLFPNVTTDVQQLEANITALAREICSETSLSLSNKNEEWASHYKDIVFSVHLVDLYICPSSSQISHAIEIGMCSMSYPVIDRNTADLMRIAIQDKLPSRLSDQCTLRKEKAGGLVSKAQPWLLTSKLRELRDNEDQERYDVLRQKLNDFHKEWSQLHVGECTELATVENANSSYEDRLALIQSFARRLWDRRIGVLVNQLFETSDCEYSEVPSKDSHGVDSDDTIEDESSIDNQWIVYLLRNSIPSIKRTYLGVTTLTNQSKRLRQHNGYLGGGAKYTKAFKGGGEWRYVMKITNLSKRQALSIEKRVKSNSCYSTKDVVERRVGRILDAVKEVVPESQEVGINYTEAIDVL